MISIVENIDKHSFYRDYVKPGRPLVIKGGISDMPAVQKWNNAYFKELGTSVNLPIKTGDVSKGEKVMMSLASYAAQLETYERELASGVTPAEKPAYLHDVPIFHIMPHLKEDVSSFPVSLFPSWYKDNWWKFVQFFMGPSNSLTPLHFDTLCTHNLFFQISGSKRFYMVAAQDRDKCYLKSWRWAKVDLEHPDFDRFPLLREAKRDDVVIDPGDVLFMPSGTLHQVRGLSASISFNIDWHTNASVLTGLMSGFQGAPSKNVFYNAVTAAGLYLRIPSRYLLKYYQSYLNYVS